MHLVLLGRYEGWNERLDADLSIIIVNEPNGEWFERKLIFSLSSILRLKIGCLLEQISELLGLHIVQPDLARPLGIRTVKQPVKHSRFSRQYLLVATDPLFLLRFLIVHQKDDIAHFQQVLGALVVQTEIGFQFNFQTSPSGSWSSLH